MSGENETRIGQETGSPPVATRVRALATLAVAVLAAGPASAAEGGLVLTPSLPMLLALIALFVALIFPVNALLFRPIFAALDAREERIAGTRARAAKLAEESEEVLKRVQGSMRETREAAEQERREHLVEAKSQANAQIGGARGEAEREIEQARREIQSAVVDARSSLRSDAETLAREASARILGRELS